MLRVRSFLPLVLLSVVVVAAQAPSPDDLILVPVMVTDPKDVPVNTLKQENFQLLEENKEQKITYFSPAGDPSIVGVVFGLSARGPVTAPGQKDRITEDITNAAARVREANTGGPGPITQMPFDSDGIFGTVTQAMDALGKQPNPRKALVIVSDGLIASGAQASSVGPPKALIEASKVSPFPIYFLFVAKTQSEPTLTEGSTYTAGYFLEQVANYSGGQLMFGEIENTLTRVSTNLRDGLKNQYLLGFKPANLTKDGKWRKLSVKVTPPAGAPKLKIKSKERYFVPKA
jgi:Ca-activated chloride channel family protein